MHTAKGQGWIPSLTYCHVKPLPLGVSTFGMVDAVLPVSTDMNIMRFLNLYKVYTVVPKLLKQQKRFFDYSECIGCI